MRAGAEARHGLSLVVEGRLARIVEKKGLGLEPIRESSDVVDRGFLCNLVMFVSGICCE